MKKLRIATMVTSHFTIPAPPPIIYASMDIAMSLVRSLHHRGHHMTVFAPQGSHVDDIPIITGDLEPLKQDWDVALRNTTADDVERGIIETIWDQSLLAHMFSQAEKGAYDLLHIHLVDRALPMAFSHPKVPVVYTLHDPIIPWKGVVYEKFSSPNQWFISISNAQRVPAPNLNYLATIYHGLDLATIPYTTTPGSYFLYVGRIFPSKGLDLAIQAARQLNEKLIIIGPVYSTDTAYWETKVKPYLSDTIVYVGHKNREEIYQYYANAKALLFPIQWEEPFGLVMIEAMACGTPVIGMRRGSVPEVVVDGTTGFVVNTSDEMVTAMTQIDRIDRQACRDHVEHHFSIDAMTDEYEKAYSSLITSVK